MNHPSSAFGITTVDTEFHRPAFDASYLIVEAGHAAFVDTGPARALPRLLAALDTAGVTPEQVDYVILTHVHLDHAGGAGALMQQLPNARLIVHPRGARHMIDPAQLVAGATAVYGADYLRENYGEIVPVPARRVTEAADGFTIELAGRPLLCLDTPGHARHHLCVWDARSRGLFTGDTFGLSYREFDTERGAISLPTTTPVQFDPEALRHSVERLLGYDPQWIFPTHYGPFGDAKRVAAELLQQLDAIVAAALPLRDAPDRHARLKQVLRELFIARLRAHGCTLPEAKIEALLAGDIELNAQGVEVWLDRR